MSSEPENPPDDASASEREEKHEEPTPQAEEEKPKEEAPEAPEQPPKRESKVLEAKKSAELVAPEPTPEEEKKRESKALEAKRSAEPVAPTSTPEEEKKRESKAEPVAVVSEPTPEGEKKRESKALEDRKSIKSEVAEAAPEGEKKRESQVLEARKSVEATPEGEKKRESKALEGRKSTEPTSEEEKRRESRASEDKRRESKMGAKESIKSLQSLGKRPSKESDKDYFARKKSQRSIRGAVGSIISFRRGSIAEYYDRQRAAKFMNTYKLDSDKPFNVDRVTKILEEVLTEALDNLTYDAEKVPKQAKWASSAIRAKVKEQEYDRYKILCIVTIGEKRSQDVYSMYRFLWDADRDKHASFVHENMSVFAVAMCFGLYYE